MTTFDCSDGVKEVEDVKLLVEALQFQEKDPPQLQQTLGALSAILSENGSAQDFFRLSSGLEYVKNIAKNATATGVCQLAFNTLTMAVEGNIMSQRALTNKGVFDLLRAKLQSKEKMLSSTCCFLLFTICSNHREGQDLARETRCLHSLCDLFKSSLPVYSVSPDSNQFTPVESTCHQLWTCTVVALDSLVQNPQNVENQKFSCQLLPLIVKILQSSRMQQCVLHPLLTLVASITSGNVECQCKVRLLGGLRALISLLRRQVFEKQAVGDDLSFIELVVNTLSSTIAGNATCQNTAGELGIVSLLLKCLEMSHRPAMSSSVAFQFRTKCIMTLSICVDRCEQNQEHLRDKGGVAFLVELLTFHQSEEFRRIATFVLYCVTGTWQANGKMPAFTRPLQKELCDDNDISKAFSKACDAGTQTDLPETMPLKVVSRERSAEEARIQRSRCKADCLVSTETLKLLKRSISAAEGNSKVECQACICPLNSKNFLPFLRNCPNLCSYHLELCQFLQQKRLERKRQGHVQIPVTLPGGAT